MRLFIAVDPGKEVLERIERALPRLRQKSPGSKWVHPKDLHITLVFLGETEDEKVPELCDILKRTAARHTPITLSFKGGGAFGSAHRPTVLWAGLAGDLDALHTLQKSLIEALVPFGHKPETRPFKAHLTLARARDAGGDHGLAACAAPLGQSDFGRARIGEIVLFRSDLEPTGPRYTPIATASFASGAEESG